MGVSKIFKVLIVMVVCMLLGAFILNIILPNFVTTAVNATEDSVFKATGMSFDWNKDGDKGSSSPSSYDGDNEGKSDQTTGGVEGFN